MSSIIGQAMQGAGPSLSAFGNWIAGSTPSTMASVNALPPTAPTVPPPPTDTAYSAGGPSSSGDPDAGASASGASAFTPTAGGGGFDPNDPSTWGHGSAAPYPGLSAGASGSPYTAPASLLNPGTTGVSSTGGAYSPVTGTVDPNANVPPTPSFGEKFWNWLSGDFGQNAGGKGMFSSPIHSLGTIGRLLQQFQAWQTARTLQDPAALAKGAAGLYRPMSKAMRRNILGPVRAEAQETGQINAPGLYAQSVATALGPYQYQMQMQALADYIEGLRASGQLQSGYGDIDELLAGLAKGGGGGSSTTSTTSP